MSKVEFKISSGSRLHFIGIGGIGMSGLAQLFAAAGCNVTGSDRGADNPENAAIIEPLRRQGIKIFPQNGAFMKSTSPDCLIYSTAIEKDNPDFSAGIAVPRLHRADALRQALELYSHQQSVAVTGSCGKTTVTAWLAEALENCGRSPSCLDGGLINCYRSETLAGNFKPGDGDFFVFEADESDKSLLNYSADFALIMNIATDHYPREVLEHMFGEFAAKTRIGLALQYEVYEVIKDKIPKKCRIVTFSTENPAADFYIDSYSSLNSNPTAIISHQSLSLPLPGVHNAENAAGVMAMLHLLGVDMETAYHAAGIFHGVWRRFDYAGKTVNGAKVYDDYAHNPEKIASFIETMQQCVPGKIFAVFQPHGYGPLGFMREALFEMLENSLRHQDEFIFLPPYYAGGTSSFKPDSVEVAASYRAKSRKHYECIPEREQLKTHISHFAAAGDAVLVMGARDNSLSDLAKQLTK
ncbi:Mur ligase family protein [Lentisphaerota bacterium ZTH]|nr:hypothetical protein JYG24_11645 [Lentisphaerota bacterium]WET05857.1 Mur ligase family protein [Lentisphaerota bacterium ZTH]